MAQRTLTANQDAARAGATPKFRGQGLYWLVEVQWAEPVGTVRYTARSFSPDPSITPIPILIEIPGCPAALDIGVSATAISSGTILTLRNDPLSASSIEAVLQDAVSPEGTVVKVFLIFDPRDGSALAEADWILINSYQIDSPPKYTYGIQPKVTFDLIDNIESAGAKKIGRVISPALFPDTNLPPSSLGRMITKVYGEVAGVQAHATVQGHVTELDGSIDTDNATIFVKTVEGFPVGGGTIKIDAEEMTYTDTTPGVNASFNGVMRGTEPTEHSDGASVVEVLALYEYALTDQVNDATTNTRVNGKAVSASVVETTVGVQIVTFLTLPELPIVSDFANVAQRTLFDGETSEWADNSSTVDSYIRQDGSFELVANNATGAIDEESTGVTFALFDPKAEPAKTSLSVVHSNDLSGRDAFLVGLDLIVTYKVIPGDNLPAAVEEFPWDDFFTEITRDGVQIARLDIPRPSPLVIRGFLDRTDFIAGLADSRALFGRKGLGSQFTAQMIYARDSATGTRILAQDPNPPFGAITFNNWAAYNGELFGVPFKAGAKSATVQTDTLEATTTPFNLLTKWLYLTPVFDPEIETITKILVELECLGGGFLADDESVTGTARCDLELRGGRPDLSGVITLDDDETQAITLEFESPLVEQTEGLGDTTKDSAAVTNFSVSMDNMAVGDLVISSEFASGSRIFSKDSADSFTVSSVALSSQTQAEITVDPGDRRESMPVTDVGRIKIRGGATRDLERWQAKIERARFSTQALRFQYWSTDSGLVGEDEPLLATTTTIGNALLASASDSFEQKIRLTAEVRNTTKYADPWDFFAEDQTVDITADAPVSSTRLMIVNIGYVATEKPRVSRQLREREIVITADVRGITDGGLLEDPESVITHLLEDSTDGWGLPSADIDGAGLTAALVGRENWKFARAITEVTTGKALLAEACRDANIRYVQDGGEIRFAGNLFPIIDDVPANAAISRAQIMPDLTKSAVHRELTINDLRLNYRRDPTGFDFLAFHEETRAQATLSNAGVQQTTLDLEWIRDRGTAEALSRRILNESATPPQVIQLMTVAMWGAHILATDIVSVEDAGANVDLIPGLVIGRNNPRGENCTFSILTRQVKIRVWTAVADTTTYIDAYQGSRLVFVINGVKVAVLDADAVFTLKGGIASTIVTGTQTEIIEKLAGPDRISFAADKGNPSRNQVGQLTAGGVLQVQFFKTNATFPSALSFSDYIVERNTGGAFGAVIFSADKARLICNMALAAIEAGRFVYDPNL